jgi:hypothetical protein
MNNIPKGQLIIANYDISGYQESEIADQWLSKVFGKDVVLIRSPSDKLRELDHKYLY